MVHQKGIFVSVECDGKTLQEYPDPDAQVPLDRIKSVYVQAVPGKRFGIRIEQGYNDIPGRSEVKGVQYEVEIDGRSRRTNRAILDEFPDSLIMQGANQWSKSRGWLLSAFQFSSAGHGECLSELPLQSIS